GLGDLAFALPFSLTLALQDQGWSERQNCGEQYVSPHGLLLGADLKRLAVDHHVRSAQQAHRRAELIGTEGGRDLVTGFERVLVPPGVLENSWTVHFAGPVHHVTRRVLHIK